MGALEVLRQRTHMMPVSFCTIGGVDNCVLRAPPNSRNCTIRDTVSVPPAVLYDTICPLKRAASPNLIARVLFDGNAVRRQCQCASRPDSWHYGGDEQWVDGFESSAGRAATICVSYYWPVLQLATGYSSLLDRCSRPRGRGDQV